MYISLPMLVLQVYPVLTKGEHGLHYQVITIFTGPGFSGGVVANRRMLQRCELEAGRALDGFGLGLGLGLNAP